jgi:phosphatidylinositol alpha-1,6-mannosyltransferase
VLHVNNRVLILAPSLAAERGGIERYSAFVVRATREVFAPDTVGVLLSGYAPTWRHKIRFVGRVAFHLLRYRPRLVILTHCHLLPALLWWHRVATFSLVVILHGVEAWQRPAKWFPDGLQTVDAWWCVSQCTASRAAAWLPPRAKTAQLPPCFDPAAFFPAPTRKTWRARFPWPEDWPMLLTVSRLEHGVDFKGHDAVLGALALLQGEFPRLGYVIAGEGPGRTQLEAFVRALGLQSKVHFAGRIADGDLADLYRAADVFVLASRREGFGMVLLEALAAGCRVVGANEGGIVDALLGGKLGQLVPSADPAALAATLASLLKEKELPSTFETRRQLLLEEFSWPAFLRRFRALCAEVFS